MIRRAFLAAALFVCVLFSAEGAPPPVLRLPFWACPDGKGMISLFWLPVRGDSPTGAGTAVGRPSPGNARAWEDTSASAGQYFWYRLVDVDAAGNRSEQSAPKWVSTGSR